MLQVKEITLDGSADRYTVAHVPAGVGWRMALRILEVNGEILAAVGKTGVLDGDPRARLAGFGAAQSTLARLFGDPAYWRDVVQPLLSVCTCNGLPVLGPAWEATYAGRLEILVGLYTAAVDHNFASFFKAFGKGNALVDGLRPEADPTAPTPSPPSAVQPSPPAAAA